MAENRKRSVVLIVHLIHKTPQSSPASFSLIRQAILVPDDVLALLARDQDIEVAVVVHIHEPNVIGSLILVNVVSKETAFAIILEPGGDEAVPRAGDRIRIAVAVDVAHRQTGYCQVEAEGCF